MPSYPQLDRPFKGKSMGRVFETNPNLTYSGDNCIIAWGLFYTDPEAIQAGVLRGIHDAGLLVVFIRYNIFIGEHVAIRFKQSRIAASLTGWARC